MKSGGQGPADGEECPGKEQRQNTAENVEAGGADGRNKHRLSLKGAEMDKNDYFGAECVNNHVEHHTSTTYKSS